MKSHLTLEQQKSIAELSVAVVYQFVGWIIALIAVVLGASKDWMIWIPAGSMVLGVMVLRILSRFKDKD